MSADNRATVSFNGGPEVPLPDMKTLKRHFQKVAKEKERDVKPGTGDNSGPVAADRLRSIVERWERLDSEIKELRSDQKDIMAEAKSAGFDTKVIRQLIAIRRKDAAEVEEQEMLLEVYKRALGMLSDTPLGAAALAAAIA